MLWMLDATEKIIYKEKLRKEEEEKKRK